MISSIGVQLSIAVAMPVKSVPELCSQEIVTAGGTVRTGFLVSVMTIVCIQTAIFPHISIACQWRVKDPVPLHKFRFCVWSLYVIVIRLVGVQLSEAMAMPRFVGDVSASHEIIAKEGQVNAGDVLSSTMIF